MDTIKHLILFSFMILSSVWALTVIVAAINQL